MTRSAGAWNVPTLSDRDWRSATEAVLGANGSWTWTKSSGARLSTSSSVRATSSGGAGAAPRREGESGSSSPTPSTCTSPSGAKNSPARISRRDSRTSSGERDGASTTIRCPRCASRRASDRTKSPTSCSSSHGWGETCAMANGALTSGEA